MSAEEKPAVPSRIARAFGFGGSAKTEAAADTTAPPEDAVEAVAVAVSSPAKESSPVKILSVAPAAAEPAKPASAVASAGAATIQYLDGQKIITMPPVYVTSAGPAKPAPIIINAGMVSAGATPATSAYLTAPPVYVTSSAVPSGGSVSAPIASYVATAPVASFVAAAPVRYTMGAPVTSIKSVSGSPAAATASPAVPALKLSKKKKKKACC